MLIEQQKRAARVRFRHPIRVVTLDGEPRVLRTLTANVSRRGLFFRMPEPLADGTKVALSLEAGGRALALAQAEVVWGRKHHQPGCGVRFTEFLHPRGKELVEYLVDNLDQGKLLTLPARKPVWRRAPVVAMFVAIALLPVGFALWNSLSPPGVRGEPELAVVSPPPPVVVPEPVVAEPLPGLTDELADAAAHAKADAVPDEGTGTEEEAEPTPGPSEPVEDVVEAVAAPEVKPAPEMDPAPGLSEPVEDGPTEKLVAAAPLPDPLPAAQGEGAPAVNAKAAPLPDPLPAAQGEGAPAVNAKAASLPDPLPAAQGEGVLRLPTGAAPKLAWHLTGSDLRLEPSLASGAQVSRAFVLSGPPRAVFDLTGGAPAKSLKVSASTPFASGVRLGKQGTGTRIVVDLERTPKRSKLEDGALVLSF